MQNRKKVISMKPGKEKRSLNKTIEEQCRQLIPGRLSLL